MNTLDITFQAKIDAVKEVIAKTSSDQGLGLSLAEWAVSHYGQSYWQWCAEKMLEVSTAYTVMRERMGECGIY